MSEADTSTVVIPPPPVEVKTDYSLAYAGKKLAWSLGFWKTAVPLGVKVAPAATQIIESISNQLSPYGISIHIDQPVFESALPIFIFAMLIMGHDFAKVKTGSKLL